MLKLLSIGNSFSQDAQRWLHDLAAAAGDELECRNLYIGGCSLERHWNNYTANEAAYGYETNGITANAPRSAILEALKSEKWDFITIQQVSQNAGRPLTYVPFLPNILAEIRKECPEAKLFFQETWEYEYCSTHGGFAYFENNCDIMFGAIHATVGYFAERYGLTVIPSGDAVHAAKKLPEFDSKNGGQSLYRDAFHMHLLYGRYLLACVWYKTLLGKSPVGIPFVPEGADGNLCSLLQGVADKTNW